MCYRADFIAPYGFIKAYRSSKQLHCSRVLHFSDPVTYFRGRGFMTPLWQHVLTCSSCMWIVIGDFLEKASRSEGRPYALEAAPNSSCSDSSPVSQALHIPLMNSLIRLPFFFHSSLFSLHFLSFRGLQGWCNGNETTHAGPPAY